MSGRPASVRARDCKQVIIAAKRAGAKQVDFQIGKGVTAIVRLDGPAVSPCSETETNELKDEIKL